MNGLHNLVVQGKVLYLGVSDTPAWVVSKANTYARLTGKTPFVIYQGAWSILERDLERDIIPMAIAEVRGSLLMTGVGAMSVADRPYACREWPSRRGTSLRRERSGRTRRRSAAARRASTDALCGRTGSAPRLSVKYVSRSRRSQLR